MITLFLKLFLYSLSSNKVFSILNILGLAVGICCSLFIFLWVHDELSYDEFHRNSNSIYRIVKEEKSSNGEMKSPYVPTPLADELKSNFTQIKNSTSIYGDNLTKYNIVYNENIIKFNVKYTNNSFFEIFDFPVVYSESNDHLFINEYSAVISKTCASKLFGNENPIGKRIKDSFYEKYYEISAVVEIPDNSSILFDILVPFSSNKTIDKIKHQWGKIDAESYIQLHKNTKLSEQQKQQLRYYLADRVNINAELFFQPMHDIHLFTDFNDDSTCNNGNIESVWAFSTAGILLLIITGLNFIILSIASSEKRNKEIALKKIYGLQRYKLTIHYIIETMIYTLFAQIISIFIFLVLQPYVNELIGKSLSLQFNTTSALYFILSLLIISLLSGAYLFFYLPSLKAINLLKGISKKNDKFRISKLLVPIQLAITIFFTICLLFVYQQTDYMRVKNTGINLNHIISINTQGFIYKYDVIRDELLKNPQIINVTASGRAPIDYNFERSNVKWDGCNKNEKNSFSVFVIAPSFLQTFSIELIKGSCLPDNMTIEKHFKGEYNNKTPIIINETAAIIMGTEHIIGKKINLGYSQANGYIVGVVKDFNFKSLKHQVTPMAMVYDPESFMEIFIKYNPKNTQAVLDYIKIVTEPYRNDEYIIDYYFLTDKANLIYLDEIKTKKFTTVFSAISIILSILGLIGMIVHTINKQKKVIAIRKVYGADSSDIIFSYVKESVFLFIFSFLIAIPFIILFLRKWFENYAYKIPISLMTFVGVFFLGTVIITLITISLVYYEAIKNPIDNLRDE